MMTAPGRDPRPFVRLVRQHLPSLPLRRVRPILTGWAHFVLDVNDEWILRFPRSPAGSPRLEREARLLAELEKRLPVPVPHYELQVRTDRGRLLFAGYRKLRGRPLPARNLARADARRWASDLGETLRALLQFPRSWGRRLEITWSDQPDGLERWRILYPKIRRRVHPLLSPRLRALDQAYWESYLAEAAQGRVTPVLNHGDLAPEHILVNEGRISGILDWEDACYEDPVGNITLLPDSGGFFERVAEAYFADHDPDFRRRVRFHRHSSTAYSILYGLETEDGGRVRKSLARYAFTLRQATSSKWVRGPAPAWLKNALG